MEAIFARHERIALQFSGGKDSIATLLQLRAYWPRLTVYWLNTGDPVPEVLETVSAVSHMVPRFVEIRGQVADVIAEHGIPSDIVPVTATRHGVLIHGGGTRLNDRYDCCARALMAPMHQRMLDDGITLIIRGQKAADAMKGPLRSGDIVDGIEYLFPIEDWSDEQALQLAEGSGLLPECYAELKASPDCLTCSAYWGDGRAAWLKARHPHAHAIYQQRLDTIREAVMPRITEFNTEASHG